MCIRSPTVLTLIASMVAACSAQSNPLSVDGFDGGMSSGSNAGTNSPPTSGSTLGSSSGSNPGTNSGSSPGATGTPSSGQSASGSAGSGSASGVSSDAGGQAGAHATSDAGPPSGEAGTSGLGDAGKADGASSPEGGTKLPGTVRIMPLGDSITGSTCWRALLWQEMNKNGFTGRFTFVGSRNSDAGCTPANYDKSNEGHPGVLVTNFVNDADELVAGLQTPLSLFQENPADIVLLHFATNDIWNSVADTTILSAYSQVLAALRMVNPKIIVLAAQLIPMAPVNTATCGTCACPACAARMVTFNAMIPAWATSHSTATSPILVVDQWTGFDATAGVDTIDGVHPNPASGCPKMADKWYSALAPLL
jgi:lysophospholipase L1-like esterase